MAKTKAPQFYFNHTALKARKYRFARYKMVNSIIDRGTFFNGFHVQKLRENIRKFLGGNGYVITCASGHDALTLALSALHLSKTDEVIFPVNSYPTAFPVCLSQGKPVPIDCDENGQLDIKSLEKKLNKNTRVIILVHLYGLTIDIEKLQSLIAGEKITLIEDCAQAFGTEYNGKPVGTFGDISCFSFYPTKNLATLGDGGAIWTKKKNYSTYFSQAKSYGEEKRYYSLFLSGHSRIPEIQAGILNLYFKRISTDFKKRRIVARYFQEKIREPELQKYIKPLDSHRNSDPVRHLFVIKAKMRTKLMEYLKRKKIETYIHYPYPIHLLPAFSYLGYKKGDFPNAERLSELILSLPFHPSLTKRAVDYILNKIKNFYAYKK